MNNTRFATVIHILTLLSVSQEEWLSSDFIAGSIAVNPVIVRKELSVLKANHFIESRKGKEGGVRLAKRSETISLADIFKAVNSSELLGKKNKMPNPNCPIGKQINSNLSDLYAVTDEVVLEFLKTKTLKDFSNKFQSN